MSYTQCRLRREAVEQTAFIPTKFAELGAVLKIRGVNGWQVLLVGGTVDDPPNVRKQIKGHRKNTGDAMPKCTN